MIYDENLMLRNREYMYCGTVVHGIWRPIRSTKDIPCTIPKEELMN